MKYAGDSPYADPEKSRPPPDGNCARHYGGAGRIHIEKINEPFLFQDKGRPAEYGAGLRFAVERGWLWLHGSGTYVKITPEGAGLFA